jgi:hypothetical protein
VKCFAIRAHPTTDVIRALFAAAQALEHLFDEPAAQASTTKKAQNAGASWPPEEDDRLVKAYDEGTNVAALAAARPH